MSFLREAWAKAGNAIEGTGRTIRVVMPILGLSSMASPDPSGLSQGLGFLFGVAGGLILGSAMVGIGKAIQGKGLFDPVAKPIPQP